MGSLGKSVLEAPGRLAGQPSTPEQQAWKNECTDCNAGRIHEGPQGEIWEKKGRNECIREGPREGPSRAPRGRVGLCMTGGDEEKSLTGGPGVHLLSPGRRVYSGEWQCHGELQTAGAAR